MFCCKFCSTITASVLTLCRCFGLSAEGFYEARARVLDSSFNYLGEGCGAPSHRSSSSPDSAGGRPAADARENADPRTAFEQI